MCQVLGREGTQPDRQGPFLIFFLLQWRWGTVNNLTNKAENFRWWQVLQGTSGRLLIEWMFEDAISKKGSFVHNQRMRKR